MSTMMEQITKIAETYASEGPTGRDAIKSKAKLDALKAELTLQRITEIEQEEEHEKRAQKKLG